MKITKLALALENGKRSSTNHTSSLNLLALIVILEGLVLLLGCNNLENRTILTSLTVSCISEVVFWSLFDLVLTVLYTVVCLFVSWQQEKQRSKVKEKLDKCVKEKLLDFCDVLNVPIHKTGKKASVHKQHSLKFIPCATLLILQSPFPNMLSGRNCSKTVGVFGISTCYNGYLACWQGEGLSLCPPQPK